MSYYTEVRVINSDGRPAEKASVSCDSIDRGYTNEQGICGFDLKYTGSYSVYAKKFDGRASGNVQAGKMIVLRLA